MILSGINFTLFFYLVKGKLRKALFDEELKWFIGSIVLFTVIITWGLMKTSSYGLEESFRKALFQVSSIHTSAGFISTDFMTWAPFLWTLLGILMFLGASTGSTSEGIKSIRLLILAKMLRNEFKQMIHPNAVLPVKVNKVAISPAIKSSVVLFIFMYILTFAFGWLVMTALGLGSIEAFGTVISTMGGSGPGLGECGPAGTWSSIPDAGKWFLSFMMLLGRLELFSVLILFTPQFWKKR